VDQLLRQSGAVSGSVHSLLPTNNDRDLSSTDRMMDSGELERERGITILSKCTSIGYKGNIINIIDTPGHADFGGEVERIMNMVDGVALIVDATEGPMTQTRFVLSKALDRGLRFASLLSFYPLSFFFSCRPLVILNKADRPTSRPQLVESDLFDLFATLGASDQQADYPLLYASAKFGWAQQELPSSLPPSPSSTMRPLFDLIMSHVPSPSHLSRSGPFSMLTVQVEADSYLGTLFLGRIHSGTLSVGDTLLSLNADGHVVGEGKVKKIFAREGLQRVEKVAAGAGEIVSIAGIKIVGGGVNCTLVHPDGWGLDGPRPLPTTPIDPPTISINVFANDSPLAGKEGTKLTSQLIKDRIYEEAQTNVALSVLPGPSSESLELRGRGVLHLGVLLEVLRREGFEFCVGPPKAVLIPDPNCSGGKQSFLEPIEECTVLVKDEYASGVVQKLTKRRGELRLYESDHPEEGWTRIVMEIPARGLIGYMAGEFKNDVHGQGYIWFSYFLKLFLTVSFL